MSKHSLNQTILREAQQRTLDHLQTASGNGNETVSIERFFSQIENSASVATQFHMPSEKEFAPPPCPQVSVPELPRLSASQRLVQAFTAKNLGVKSRIRMLPVIGYGFSILGNLIRLPLFRLQVQQQQEVHAQRIQQLQQQLEQQLVAVNRLLNDRINELEPYLRATVAVVDRNFSLHDQRLQDLENVHSGDRLRSLELLDTGSRLMRLEKIEAERKIQHFARLLQVSERENAQLRTQLQEVIQTRVNAPPRATPQESEPSLIVAQNQLANPYSGKALVDRFFRDFEDQFRGTREAIKQRLEVYLPYFEAGRYDRDALVIDIGCGRGEWLELLAQNQISALGLDLNIEKVQACIEQGLAARTADGLEFLQGQEANSVGAITGFHLIEHLPFDVLLSLFEAAYRVLKPGGLIIFETPNPENVLVGSCNFYFDPSHQNPIVPAVAQFIAKQSGFTDTEIVRLHPYPDEHLAKGQTDVDRLINRYFFGAQDFALIARK